MKICGSVAVYIMRKCCRYFLLIFFRHISIWNSYNNHLIVFHVWLTLKVPFSILCFLDCFFFHQNWQRICRKFVDTLLCSLDRFKLVKFVANISISNVPAVMWWWLCQFTGLQWHLPVYNIGGYIPGKQVHPNMKFCRIQIFCPWACVEVLCMYRDCLFKGLLIFMVEAVCKLMLALICGWSFYLSMCIALSSLCGWIDLKWSWILVIFLNFRNFIQQFNLI